MSKITIRMLASQLGLSIATVSKALKDSYEISTETKKRVQDLASRLEYTPNPHASSLRKQKSKTIAIILPEVADNFFSLAINGIQSVATSEGYHVLIYLSHEDYEIEKEALHYCSNGRVDGILISASSKNESVSQIEKLQKENIPIVFFDRDMEDCPAPKVITNDYECGQLAARYLINKGCKKPIFLLPLTALSIFNKRAAGFISVLKSLDINTEDVLHNIDCSHGSHKITDQILSILKQENSTDGIVASVEKLAIQTYMACLNSDLRIPKDIKVIAFSTLETAPILNPSLTTIVQPAFEIGQKAAELLFKMIEKKKNTIPPDFKIILNSILTERNSSL